MKLFICLLFGWAATLAAAEDIINPLAPEDTVLTADSLDMRSTPTETIAICIGNVLLRGTNMSIACDRLEIRASRVADLNATIGEFKGFQYLLAEGNVRLVQGDREASCGRAEVLPEQGKVVLYDDPVVIDRSSDFIAAGTKITLYRGERRIQVENPRLTGPPINDLGPEAVDTTQETAASPATE
jgi:lipopolysaccharide export system protein LptA